MWAMTEADAQSFVDTFRGVAGRAVVISSGDVYRAFGCFHGREAGPPDPIPLAENAPLRKSRYPYREKAPSADHWMVRYDKILVEQAVMSQTDLPATILRFPAVLGPNEYRRFQRWLKPIVRGETELRIQESWSEWRWTHGLAEDVAEAVVLAATNPIAAGSIYNRWRIPHAHYGGAPGGICSRGRLGRPHPSSASVRTAGSRPVAV